eukprot:CFRG6230T1
MMADTISNSEHTAHQSTKNRLEYTVRLWERETRNKQMQWTGNGKLEDEHGQMQPDTELAVPEGFEWVTPWRMPDVGQNGDDMGWLYAQSWTSSMWVRKEQPGTVVRRRCFVRRLGCKGEVTADDLTNIKKIGAILTPLSNDMDKRSELIFNTLDADPSVLSTSHNPDNSSDWKQDNDGNRIHVQVHSHLDPPKSLPALDKMTELSGKLVSPSSSTGAHSDGDISSTTSSGVNYKSQHLSSVKSKANVHVDSPMSDKSDKPREHSSSDAYQSARSIQYTDNSGMDEPYIDRELRITKTENGTVAEYDEVVYENQRSGLVGGFSTNWLIPYVDKRGEWSRKDGQPISSIHNFTIPVGWEWANEWTSEDWKYAFSFWDKVWSDDSTNGSFVRRRMWVRTRHMLLDDRRPSLEDNIKRPINELQLGGFITSCVLVVCFLLCSSALLQIYGWLTIGSTISLI